MEGKVLARIAAIVFIAVALTATIIEMTREDVNVPAPSAPAFQPPADPLREGQRHCQQLGEAAANDPTCLRIWAETRDRFLGRTPGPATPAPNGGK
ncbi:conjugal transfer protein TrbK (plasmid) [Paracoccus versutus]|jgi:conjugative transfer region protein TrbK|uniref:Conjugative transfer region protein TrbK n=2 Tax=Alphaproteobacteria TaxID=28211 RepID=A0A7W6J9N8_9HYPH|nr:MULTISPECIES: putative entry exclusion protein TrbK-alt [Alphaproteobacteria]KGJ12657.1 conjugal transfer protein TrbK [Paracoccus versutus]MBB4067332.1 conjugative transfer region protein TrbK [Gellertiella hungarica]REG53337.1 conjugative transfer region protein TrbK [Paracoccus versutus]WEJ81242.1 conjugal transfer protein TrbK [Paracoccus versutus]